MLFLDVLSYAAAFFGLCALTFVGAALLSTKLTTHGLSAFVGTQHARECLRDGSFKPQQARSAGVLLLAIVAFLAYCILRGFAGAHT